MVVAAAAVSLSAAQIVVANEANANDIKSDFLRNIFATFHK